MAMWCMIEQLKHMIDIPVNYNSVYNALNVIQMYSYFIINMTFIESIPNALHSIISSWTVFHSSLKPQNLNTTQFSAVNFDMAIIFIARNRSRRSSRIRYQ